LNIAVNTRLLLKDRLEGIGTVIFETMKRITKDHPEHHFFFLFDRDFDPEFLFSDNITPIIIGPQARHPILFYLWFEHSIPRVLKDIKADIFISPDGYMSLSTKVKSLSIIHDLNFEQYPEHFPWLIKKYYHYYFPRFAKRADRIATVSEFSKQDIITRYKINPDKIDVIYNGVNPEFKPLSPETISETRSKYSSGDPYFIFVGSIQPRKNIKNLLLAFDLFKTNYPQPFKLIIAGAKKWWTPELQKTLEEMKYKTDVIFTGRVPEGELMKIMGAAFAMTYVPFYEGFGIPILEAFNTGIPVITSDITSMPEVANGAAILVNPHSSQSIADGMMSILRDDKLKQDLISEGNIRKNDFSWDKSAELLWKSIERLMHTT
jgi:glycosyltransferase involved in cell wall biosynthesis